MQGISLLGFAMALASQGQSSASTTTNRGFEGGLGVQAELLYPLSDQFGSRRLGFGGALSFWGESPWIAFQPRWSIGVGPGSRGAYYLNMDWALGVFLLPIKGKITPIIGGGAGARYLYVRGVTDRVSVGTVLTASVEQRPVHSFFGFSAFARGGVLLFRDSPTHLMLTAEYSAGFFGESGIAHGMVFQLGLTI